MARLIFQRCQPLGRTEFFTYKRMTKTHILTFRITLLIVQLLFAISCSIHKPNKSKDSGYYENLRTTIINGADLLTSLEIDSGQYTLLMYEHFSNVRNRTHSFHGKNIYFKVDSLEVFRMGDYFEIPSEQIDVKAFFSNYRCFVCKVDSISGSLQKLTMTQDSITLAIDLKYRGQNRLLKDTITFSLDNDFFDTFFVDYKGEYDNLRIALKEPLKVKKLELFGYMRTYGFDSLPESFGEMKNIEELDLSNLSLKKLPLSFSSLSNLKILDLSYNDFEAFPTQVYELKNLEVLNLKLSHLDTLPPGIGQLKKLRILILDDNKFNDFPFAVTELSNLEELSITSSNISTVPSEIMKLNKLRRLDLSSFWSYKHKNQISDISNLTSLTVLESLDLDWNKIERLPNNLCDLKNLKKLSLLSNPIKDIPENIQRCRIDTLLVDTDEADSKPKGHKRGTKD